MTTKTLPQMTDRQAAVAKIAKITGEAAAKRAAAVATRDADLAEWKRDQKIADTSHAKAADSESRVLSLDFETQFLINRQREILGRTVEQCIPEAQAEIRRMKSEARGRFASRETSVRDASGERLRDWEGRRPIERLTNSDMIGDFLSRAKVAEDAIEMLTYSPLSPLEIEAEVDRILEAMGPISQPRPIVVDC